MALKGIDELGRPAVRLEKWKVLETLQTVFSVI